MDCIAKMCTENTYMLHAWNLPLSVPGRSIQVWKSAVDYRLLHAGMFVGQLLQSPLQSNWQVVILIQQESVQFRRRVGRGIIGEFFEFHQCSFPILDTGCGFIVRICPSGHLLLIGWVEPVDDDVPVHLPHRLITGAPSCCQICMQPQKHSKWTLTTLISYSQYQHTSTCIVPITQGHLN